MGLRIEKPIPVIDSSRLLAPLRKLSSPVREKLNTYPFNVIARCTIDAEHANGQPWTRNLKELPLNGRNMMHPAGLTAADTTLAEDAHRVYTGNDTHKIQYVLVPLSETPLDLFYQWGGGRWNHISRTEMERTR